MSDEMAEAHSQDYADKRRIDELVATIEAFLAEPPGRCHQSTRSHLLAAVVDLHDDAAHIVRTWD